MIANTERRKQVQAVLGVTPDGIFGAKTRAAFEALAIAPDGAPVPIDTPAVDARSEKAIATLLPHVRPVARALVRKAGTAGVTIKVISGTRTYDEQDALFRQGRTEPGRIVTNARAGYSNHNFGIAFDIGVFDADGRYIEEGPGYKKAGEIGTALGLTWGGDWKSLVDEPHFELRPVWAREMSEPQMLAELRRRKGAGEALV